MANVNKEITIALPPEVEAYADDIRRFVDAMVFKLKMHSKKGKWEALSLPECLELLEGEVRELRDAVKGHNLIEILLEAGDVGNYALIIASIAIERGSDV
jgi:hypothetical protein